MCITQSGSMYGDILYGYNVYTKGHTILWGQDVLSYVDKWELNAFTKIIEPI